MRNSLRCQQLPGLREDNVIASPATQPPALLRAQSFGNCTLPSSLPYSPTPTLPLQEGTGFSCNHHHGHARQANSIRRIQAIAKEASSEEKGATVGT